MRPFYMRLWILGVMMMCFLGLSAAPAAAEDAEALFRQGNAYLQQGQADLQRRQPGFELQAGRGHLRRQASEGDRLGNAGDSELAVLVQAIGIGGHCPVAQLLGGNFRLSTG